tara:strand:+ start:2796 stop:5495 length:2700 start_codon:yes stop_codon:yes gene_type:complete
MGIAKTLAGAYAKTGKVNTGDVMKKGQSGELFQDTSGAATINTSNVEPPVRPVEPPVNKPEDVNPQIVDENVETAEQYLDEDLVVNPARQSDTDPLGRNFNILHVNDPEDLRRIIEVEGNKADNFRQPAQPHSETLSKVEAQDPEEWYKLTGYKVGDGVTPEAVAGARIQLQRSSKNLKEMAQTILAGDRGADAAFHLQFRQAISSHVAIQQSVAGMAADAGRSLNAFRIPVDSSMGGKSEVFKSTLEDVMDKFGGEKTVRNLAKVINDAEDLEDISKAASKLHHAKFSDMVLEYWVNGLLSSPATHVVNMTSNAFVASWAIPERLLAVAIGKVRRDPDAAEWGEVLGQMYGLFHGTRDGLRLSYDALKTAEPTDPAMKLEARKYNAITGENVSKLTNGMIEANGTAAKGIDYLGEFTRLSGRFLGAEDEFFKSVGYRMELNALAFRTAKKEGLQGDELAQRVHELIENPPEQIHIDAMNMSRVQTFTNNLGESGQKIQNISNAHPLMKMLLPFVRTPTNIVKYIAHRQPFLAPFSQNVRQEILAGGARRDAALSKLTLGSLVTGTGVKLAFEDQLTGGGPKDPETRRALMLTGWQPYSLKIGDTWHSYNRLDPLGMFLGLAADTAEVMRSGSDEDRENIALITSLALAKNLTSKTYLRGISDTLNAINDPDRYAERYFQRMGATFTPATSLVSQIERYMDPTMREAHTMLEMIQSRTPFLSDKLPPRRSLWGEPVVLQGGMGWDFVSPIYTSLIKDDPVAIEMADQEMGFTMPSRKVDQGKYATEMTNWEYDDYVQLVGKKLKLEHVTDNGKYQELNLHDYIGAIMKTQDYKELTDGPDGGKTNMVLGIISDFKNIAKNMMLDEDSEYYNKELYDRVKENRDKDLKAKYGEEVWQQYQ